MINVMCLDKLKSIIYKCVQAEQSDRTIHPEDLPHYVAIGVMEAIKRGDADSDEEEDKIPHIQSSQASEGFCEYC